MVESFIGMFSPYADLSRGLQETLRLDRLPACRSDHGRLEILLRGAGLTDRPLEERIAVAQQITDAARPLLRLHRKREHRRYAERAIAVVFEDEQLASAGIATMRFTFLASHDTDPRQ
ncbi:MAG: hypothetical protein ABI026_11650 [Gemmatimonadaceae bacterium]